jgi:hypothetical protein
MSKIFWGQSLDPHSKEEEERKVRKGKKEGEGKERGGEHPQIKFYDYNTEADELSLAVANLHSELELCRN